MPPGREDFGEEVARRDLHLRRPDGTLTRVAARIGKPYEVTREEWACPAEVAGLDPRYPDMRGADSLQALCLAISLVSSRLEAVIEKGGTLVDVTDGTVVDLDQLRAAFGHGRKPR